MDNYQTSYAAECRKIDNHLEWLKQHPDELMKAASFCLHKIGLIPQNEYYDSKFEFQW